MDHHCWWTANCVAYNTFKPFFLLSVYVVLLTLIGVSTIVTNFYTTNIEHDEGITGFLCVFETVMSPTSVYGLITQTGDNNLVYFDIYLIQFSVGFGALALVMAGSLIASVK